MQPRVKSAGQWVSVRRRLVAATARRAPGPSTGSGPSVGPDAATREVGGRGGPPLDAAEVWISRPPSRRLPPLRLRLAAARRHTTAAAGRPRPAHCQPVPRLPHRRLPAAAPPCPAVRPLSPRPVPSRPSATAARCRPRASAPSHPSIVPQPRSPSPAHPFVSGGSSWPPTWALPSPPRQSRPPPGRGAGCGARRRPPAASARRRLRGRCG